MCKVAETEEEERERLKKWDEFLEGDDDETDKNPAQAKTPAANKDAPTPPEKATSTPTSATSEVSDS